MQPRSDLDIRTLLKTFRRRLDPETTRVGAYRRPNTRSVRHITQEEIAEVIGMGRNRYALLENGTPVRPSLSLLERLADALRLSPAERTRLFLLRFRLSRAASSVLRAPCPKLPNKTLNRGERYVRSSSLSNQRRYRYRRRAARDDGFGEGANERGTTDAGPRNVHVLRFN